MNIHIKGMNNTYIQGKASLSEECKHEFKGSYEFSRLNSSICQDLKRDIISLKRLGQNKVELTLIDRNKVLTYTLPLIYADSTYSRIKNAILQYTHLQRVI